MPCNTISTVKLNLQNANMEWFMEALKRTNNAINITKQNNTVTWRTNNILGKWCSFNQGTGVMVVPNEGHGQNILQQYAAVLVENISGQFGWQTTNLGNGEYQLQKASY